MQIQWEHIYYNELTLIVSTIVARSAVNTLVNTFLRFTILNEASYCWKKNWKIFQFIELIYEFEIGQWLFAVIFLDRNQTRAQDQKIKHTLNLLLPHEQLQLIHFSAIANDTTKIIVTNICTCILAH